MGNVSCINGRLKWDMRKLVHYFLRVLNRPGPMNLRPDPTRFFPKSNSVHSEMDQPSYRAIPQVKGNTSLACS
jgi:hypothetical protein